MQKMRSFLAAFLFISLIAPSAIYSKGKENDSDTAKVSDKKGHFPDHFYELIGTLNEFKAPMAIASQEKFEFAYFWSNEKDCAEQFYRRLRELKENGVLTGEITLTFNEHGNSTIHAESARKLLRQVVVEDDSSYYGWKFDDTLYSSATEEQLEIYLKAVYRRSGVRRYNIIQNAHVSTGRLVSLLNHYCFEIITVRTNTRTPDSELIIFMLDAEHSDLIDFDSIAGLRISDAAVESISFPWLENLPLVNKKHNQAGNDNSE